MIPSSPPSLPFPEFEPGWVWLAGAGPVDHSRLLVYLDDKGVERPVATPADWAVACTRPRNILPSARAALEQAAAPDPLWAVAPPMALGASAGTVTLNVSFTAAVSKTTPEGSVSPPQAASTKTKATPSIGLNVVQ